MTKFIFREFDNIFNTKQIHSIAKVLASKDVDWHCCDFTVSEEEFKNTKYPNVQESISFVHRLTDELGNGESVFKEISDYVLKHFLEATGLKIKQLYRCRLNMLIGSNFPQDCYTTPHVDSLSKHMILIYYVCDSDGPTKIFSKDMSIIHSCEPKAGKFLLINGGYDHAATGPVKTQKRIVINFNFLLEDQDAILF